MNGILHSWDGRNGCLALRLLEDCKATEKHTAEHCYWETLVGIQKEGSSVRSEKM